MATNIFHCPVCGVKTPVSVSDFNGDEIFICSNGHSTVYHFPGNGEPSSFDCSKCGKTHILFDEFDFYPRLFGMMFDRIYNSMYKIFNW